jgi:hypothetical protein
MEIRALIIHQRHETSMLPAACLSALLCPLVVWPFASPFNVSIIDLPKLFLLGTTQFELGLVFLTISGQLVSATETALINTLETPLVLRGRHNRLGGGRGSCLAQQSAFKGHSRRRHHENSGNKGAHPTGVGLGATEEPGLAVLSSSRDFERCCRTMAVFDAKVGRHV